MAKLAAVAGIVRMLEGKGGGLRTNHGAQEQHDENEPRAASMEHPALF
jgi:hypothetical protein